MQRERGGGAYSALINLLCAQAARACHAVHMQPMVKAGHPGRLHDMHDIAQSLTCMYIADRPGLAAALAAPLPTLVPATGLTIFLPWTLRAVMTRGASSAGCEAGLAPKPLPALAAPLPPAVRPPRLEPPVREGGRFELRSEISASRLLSCVTKCCRAWRESHCYTEVNAMASDLACLRCHADASAL